TLGDESPYLFFVPAVLVAAGLAGLGPGLLATVVSTLLAIFVVPRSHEITTAEIINGSAFMLLCMRIAGGVGQLHRTRQRAALSTRDALAREAHLKSILDTVPEATIVIDQRAIIQSFSSAAERLFGHTAEEVIGKNIKMLMPSPYRE